MRVIHLAVGLTCGCSPPFDPPAAPSPLSDDVAPHVFLPDVPYDTWERTRLDLYRPDADGPVPAVVYVHAGGFVEGDEDALAGQRDYLPTLLGEGIAVASVAYRLLEEHDTDGVKKPMGDVRRALQFLRHHAVDLGLDPERLAADGTSAGAGTVVWLATQSEGADASAEDPVARASTAWSAVNANEVQATYDLVKWETELFADEGLTLELIAALGFESYLASLLGAPDLAAIRSPAWEGYRADVDMLTLVHEGMPPLRLENSRREDVHPVLGGQSGLLHHPVHGEALYRAALAVGADVVGYVPTRDIDSADGLDRLQWLTARLRE